MGDEELKTLWAKACIGDIAIYVNGRAFKPSEWERVGKPIIRIQNLNKPTAEYNYSSLLHELKYSVDKGDLLFAWSASLGAYIWSGENAWLNQHIFKVIPLNGIDKLFVYYLLQYLTEQMYAKSHGSGMVHITKGKFESTKIELPPTKEQHRIVDKIEELFSEIDKGVESLKTARAQLQVYRQALLKYAFEGKLTAQWRSDNPDKVLPAAELLRSIEQAREERYQQQLTDWQTAVEKERNGDKLSKPKLLKPNSKVDINFIIDKELPKNWCWVTFEHLLEYITSGSRGWAEYYSETGSIFVRAQNLKYDKLDLTDLAHVELPENAEGIRSKLNFGDILITITGANVTKTGVVTTDLKDAYVSQHVALCRSTNIDWFEYLYFYLLSEVGGRKQLTSAAYGAGKPGLNLANIKLVAIPFCNYAEQRIIVSEIKSHLSIIENTEADIDRDIVKAEMLRQSILKKAFSGQLVPQDPTDEPASELLKRIQAEKADRETKTKRKSTKQVTSITH